MKFKVLFSFVCVSLALPCFAVTSALVKPWVFESFSQSRVEIITRMINEEGPDPVLVDDPSENRPFGRNFSGINLLKLQCLTEIHSRYLTQKTKIPTLDIGAGKGYASWKFLAAGGQVTAIELQRKMAKALSDHLTEKTKSILHPEVVSHDSRVLVGDFLRLTEEKRREQFQIIWSGNNLHFFQPQEVKKYVAKVAALLAPGGRAYLSAITPAVSTEFVGSYLKAKAKNALFPGYSLASEVSYPGKSYRRDVDGAVRPVRFPLDSRPLSVDEIHLPGQAFDGAIEEKQQAIENKQEELALFESKMGVNKKDRKIVHIATHSFDTVTLERVFSEAGLVVEETFYFEPLTSEDHFLSKKELSVKDRMSRPWMVAIRAYKPLTGTFSH